MSMLSGPQIATLVASGTLGIEPFDEDLVKGASYDLRLHAKILVSPIGPNDLGDVVHLTNEKPSYHIQPGQMVGTLTLEVVSLPDNISGRFGIRSDFARLGVDAFGGLQLDPGWRGRYMLNLLNVGPEPVIITQEMPLFSVEFHYVDGTPKPYSGPHQDQYDFSKAQVEYIVNARTTSLAEIPKLRHDMGRLSILVEELDEKLPDPDEGLELRPEIKRRLVKCAQAPRKSLLTAQELRQRLDI